MLAPERKRRKAPPPGALWRGWCCAAVLLGVLSFTSAAEAQRIRVSNMATRQNQNMWLLSVQPTEAPVGAVVLIPGGHGNLGLTPGGRMAWGANDPVIRTRLMFAHAGFVAVAADVASDLKRGPGVVGGYRWGEAHARDLGALVRNLRSFGVPVHLVGFDRGALSVANAAARLIGPERPDSLVMISAPLVDTGHDHASLERDIPGLNRIDQPILTLAHPADTCRATPPGAMQRFRALVPKAARVEMRTLVGGQMGRGDPCDPNGAHGFLGRDQMLVDTVAKWLKELPR